MKSYKKKKKVIKKKISSTQQSRASWRRVVFLVMLGIPLAIFLLFAGYIVMTKTSKPSAQTTSTTPEEVPPYEVVYTDDGYQPATLEIPAGARVAFRNESSVPMWTASDPHPVHTDFSAFDAKRNYASGETYTFQFTTTGTFGYHNHEKSIHRGIIYVIDRDHPLPNIDKTKESQRATRDTLLALFDQSDPGSIFTVIDAIERNNALSRDCHDIAHDLGHRAYELFGFSGAMTFSDPNRKAHASVDDICAGGYMHGILEEAFLHQPSLKEHPGSLCASIPEVNRSSCFHGVGHGLMFVNQRDVAKSLETCRAIGEESEVPRCFEGVWMELFWGDTSHAGANSLGWTPESPLEPYRNASGDEKPSCFLYAHLGYLRNHRQDFSGAISLCAENNLSASDEKFCLRGIGMTMMKHFTSHHLDLTENVVQELNDIEKNAYYQGVIRYARLSSVSEANLNAFCHELKHDKNICLTLLQTDPK